MTRVAEGFAAVALAMGTFKGRRILLWQQLETVAGLEFFARRMLERETENERVQKGM